jgi:hypothetical protein
MCSSGVNVTEFTQTWVQLPVFCVNIYEFSASIKMQYRRQLSNHCVPKANSLCAVLLVDVQKALYVGESNENLKY